MKWKPTLWYIKYYVVNDGLPYELTVMLWYLVHTKTGTEGQDGNKRFSDFITSLISKKCRLTTTQNNFQDYTFLD